MAVQTTTWREIEILRGMEEAAVEYNLGAQESKLPHTRDGRRTHSRRMIHVTPAERNGRRTIWGPTDLSASLQLLGK